MRRDLEKRLGDLERGAGQGGDGEAVPDITPDMTPKEAARLYAQEVRQTHDKPGKFITNGLTSKEAVEAFALKVMR